MRLLRLLLSACLCATGRAYVSRAAHAALRPPCLRAPRACISHTFDFRTVPLRVGVQHIHSPEHFLAAHSVCPPVLCVESVQPPVRVGEYHVVALRLRTWLGPVDVRVFSNDRLSSEFLLLTPGGCALMLGQLRVEPLGVGCRLRMYADRVRPPGAWDWACPETLLEWALRPAEATQAGVEAAMRAGYRSLEEEPNLRAYRCQVMF